LARAYVGLGANLGDREATIRRALDLLAADPGSSSRRSRRFARPTPSATFDQPRFLNGVAALDTELRPRALLERLLATERSLGRMRGRRYGPRTIDLDLLLYGGETVEEPGLVVPHPRLHERAFVLEPLAELDPGLVVPGRGPLAALLAGYNATMSHLDELDEFEAELELALKREYTAVFSLFRYCVLTQDAT